MDHLAPTSGVSWFTNNPFGDLLGGSQLPPMELGGLDVGGGGEGRQLTTFMQYASPPPTVTSQVPLVNSNVQYIQEHPSINLLEEAHMAQHDIPPEPKATNKIRPALGEKIACEICSATFACGANLRNHLRIHTGERPFVCEECGASFTQRSNLRSHKRVHTGERPYMCGICGQRFARSSHLPGHMRTHTGEKPFNCPHCGRSFATNQIMKNHMRTHTGERPFVCNICYATFAQSSCLATHKKIHTGERNFICSECGKAFISRSGLQTHFRVHTGEKPYTCEKCDKSFKTSSYLSKHKQKYCGNTGYKGKMESSSPKKVEKKTSVRKMGKSVKAVKTPSRLPKRCLSKRIRRSRRHREMESEEEVIDNVSNSASKESSTESGEVRGESFGSKEHSERNLKKEVDVIEHCNSQENQDPLGVSFMDDKFYMNSPSYHALKLDNKDQQYQLCEHVDQMNLGEHCVSVHVPNVLTEEYLDPAQNCTDEQLKPTSQVLLESLPLQITEEQQQQTFLARNGDLTWYSNYV